MKLCHCRKMAQASSVDADGNDQDVAALNNRDPAEEVCLLENHITVFICPKPPGTTWLGSAS